MCSIRERTNSFHIIRPTRLQYGKMLELAGFPIQLQLCNWIGELCNWIGELYNWIGKLCDWIGELNKSIKPLCNSFKDKLKEEARLDRTLCPVKVENVFLLIKDIKANKLVAIMINLIKVPLFCTEDSYFTCNLG